MLLTHLSVGERLGLIQLFGYFIILTGMCALCSLKLLLDLSYMNNSSPFCTIGPGSVLGIDVYLPRKLVVVYFSSCSVSCLLRTIY